ncbi:Cas9 inhibitor AcrIIA9 family protein [Flavobacterium sp. DGU38]|uniref:Cas9 inhibitor AcrIIA9 family protein n=1 Tax=Flavobacterium calami TaxID=3139144 RepID=A0ABU9INS8_9FLAO
MKTSDNFKAVIENFLSGKALSDTAFAQNFSKASKNLEGCFNYIFAEVKKTGLCAFADQEIFDLAVKYYSDDAIEHPQPVNCRAVVNQPAKADLFTSLPEVSKSMPPAENKMPASKPESKTLTLFDL